MATLTLSTLPSALLAPSSSAQGAAAASALSRNRAARQTAFSSYLHPDACNLPLDVCEGAIPDWLSGVYYRNGPGLFEDATGRRLEHLFDGYAMLARVALKPGRPPLLTTRFVDSEAHRAARSGEMAYAEFMTPRVPPGSGFAAVAKAFAALALGDPADNACVSVMRRGGSLQAMSEPQRSWVEFDPVTLATERKVAWEEGAEDAGQLGTAHALRDPRGGGWINVATKISPPLWNEYQVHRMDDAAPARRELLARIPCGPGAAPNWRRKRVLDFGRGRPPWPRRPPGRADPRPLGTLSAATAPRGVGSGRSPRQAAPRSSAPSPPAPKARDSCPPSAALSGSTPSG